MCRKTIQTFKYDFFPKELIWFFNSARRTEKMEELTRHLRRSSIANKCMSIGQNLIGEIIKIFTGKKCITNIMWLQRDSISQPLSSYKNTQLVWLNGWVFVYELNGCGFEPCCSHLIFRYRTCFEQEVPWHPANVRV